MPRGEKSVKHGHKRNRKPSPEYRTWLGMKRRCYDAKYKDYPNWGGRGIRVCDEWNKDFTAFLRDMGLRPSIEHTIDRLDPNKNYEPGNCRWATLQEQGAENRRNIYQIEVHGVTYPSMAAAARHFGVGITTVHNRIKTGIPIEQAFTSSRLKSRRDKQSYWRKELRPDNVE